MARRGASNCARASSKSSAELIAPSARGGTGGFVVLPPQPGTQADTANGPGLPVSVDHEIGKRGAIGGVKQLRAGRQIGQHISRRLPHDLGTRVTRIECRINSGGARVLGRGEVSFRREFRHSLRAILIASMPTCFHHARSSRTR